MSSNADAPAARCAAVNGWRKEMVCVCMMDGGGQHPDMLLKKLQGGNVAFQTFFN